jgi:hypothetical protein
MFASIFHTQEYPNAFQPIRATSRAVTAELTAGQVEFEIRDHANCSLWLGVVPSDVWSIVLRDLRRIGVRFFSKSGGFVSMLLSTSKTQVRSPVSLQHSNRAMVSEEAFSELGPGSCSVRVRISKA